MTKQCLYAGIGVLCMLTPTVSFALTDDVKSQVVTLLARIQVLMLQLQGLQAAQGTTDTGAAPSMPDISSSQSTTIGQGALACPRLDRDLAIGTTGDDVAELQSYLMGMNFLESGPTTAYFGSKTEAAVRAFQIQNDVSPVGAVGPTTRGVIARNCGYKTPKKCAPPPQTLALCTNGSWTPVYDANDCLVTYNCTAIPAYTPTSTPVIPIPNTTQATPQSTNTFISVSPLSGDAPLSVIFSTQNQQSGAVYGVDFGDGTSGNMTPANVVCVTAPCAVPLQATHVYSTPGVYTARFQQTLTTSAPKIISSATITVNRPSVISGIPQITAPTNVILTVNGTVEDHVHGFYVRLDSVSPSTNGSYIANLSVVSPSCSGWPSDSPSAVHCMIAVTPLHASLTLGQTTPLIGFSFTLLAIDSASARISITAAQ